MIEHHAQPGDPILSSDGRAILARWTRGQAITGRQILFNVTDRPLWAAPLWAACPEEAPIINRIAIDLELDAPALRVWRFTRPLEDHELRALARCGPIALEDPTDNDGRVAEAIDLVLEHCSAVLDESTAQVLESCAGVFRDRARRRGAAQN